MKTLVALFTLIFFVSTTAFSGDFPKGSPAFEHKLSDALAKAKETNKPVIAIFSAVWCGPCQTMKKDVYPSAAVKPYLEKFIWAYLDADDSSNAADMKKFNVNGIPHIEFLDSTGKSVGQQVGSSSPESFAKTLEGILKKAK
ncbi:MAG: thioredoxin family protein [Verrucomicrobia bacterium]|nr:thioredoxin family protein [Verrucomicrobiota bacterium]